MVRWVAAAAIVVIIAAIMNISLQLFPQNQNHDFLTASSIVELYTLTAVDPDTFEGRGTACILRQGDKNQLIIYSWGLQATQLDEVYQVWYSHEGVQYNAGSFIVDPYGYGVLTYELDLDVVSIDDLEITLEENGVEKEPSGKKVLGSNV